MTRLFKVFGWLLVAAIICFHKELDQFFVANPHAIWAALTIMLVFMFRQAYRRELEKRQMLE